MQAYDSKVLGERLNELAELFDKRPVSEKGLTVWFNVLREFPTEKVCSALLSWPKTHTKFPSPAEVWKVVNDVCVSEREAKAQRENKEPVFYPGVGGAQAEKFIAEIRKTLNRPKWSPMQHWQKVFETATPGSIGHRYATEVLKQKHVLKDEQDDGQAVNF